MTDLLQLFLGLPTSLRVP